MGRCVFKKYILHSSIFYLRVSAFSSSARYLHFTVSRWRHLIGSIVCFVVGGLVLSILPHVPAVAPFIAPFLVLLTLPALYVIGTGLHQLIKYVLYLILFWFHFIY
jgi:hypothetical protein